MITPGSILLNDRHQTREVYKSICSGCRFMDRVNFTCPAYPRGIPDKLLDGTITSHDSPIKGQTGDTIFELR